MSKFSFRSRLILLERSGGGGGGWGWGLFVKKSEERGCGVGW